MRPGEKAPLLGNAAVVTLLERWTEEAREGNLGSVGLARVVGLGKTLAVGLIAGEYPGYTQVDYVGLGELQPMALQAADLLKEVIKADLDNKEMPPQDESLDASYCRINLAKDTPMSWDFLPWIIDREMDRRREKAPGSLKVAFWRGGDGKTGIRGREQMFYNVVRPLIKLVGGIEDDRAMLGRSSTCFVMRNISDASRKGEEIPVLHAPEDALEAVRKDIGDGPPPITITLREALHWPHRNSNMEAWIKFAGDLKAQGERVIFIRDTMRAIIPLEGFQTCVPAAVSVEKRMALYEMAKCNLLISTGPASLCLFSDRPYLYFVAVDELDPQHANRPGFWRNSHGIPEGEQLPWARTGQRIIWKSDTYENICRAWEARDG